MVRPRSTELVQGTCTGCLAVCYGVALCCADSRCTDKGELEREWEREKEREEKTGREREREAGRERAFEPPLL